MAEYGEGSGISMSSGGPDLNSGYERFKSNISGFVEGLQNVATRFESEKAKEKAPQDVENGTFKPLPPLSSVAQAYNSVGEQFEQSSARLHLQAAAQGLQQNLIHQSIQAGKPIGQQDIENFSKDFSEIAKNVSASVSSANKPYIDNMAPLIGNQSALGIQNKMDAQNKSLTQYSTINNVNTLTDSMASSLAQGDINASINYGLQARKAAQETALLLGGSYAANFSKKVNRDMANNIGIGFAQQNQNPEQSRKMMDMVASGLKLSEEDKYHMHLIYNSHLSQIAQSNGINASIVGKELKNYQENIENGNIPPQNVISALGIRVNQVAGAEGVSQNAQWSALQQATPLIQSLKYAPLKDRIKVIQDLHQKALQSSDHTFQTAATIVSRALTNINDAAIKDSAAYSMNSPPVLNLMAQNNNNQDAQQVSGHQLATTQMNMPIPLAILQHQRDNQLPLAVLSNKMAKNTILQVTSNPSFSQGVTQLQQTLDYYKQSHTESYAISDLLRNNLPPSYIIALNMQNTSEKELFNAAMDPSYQPGHLSSGIDEKMWKQVQQKVHTVTSSYQAASANIDDPNSTKMVGSMIDATNRLTAIMVARGGDPSDSSKKAAQEIIGNNYSVKNNLFIPKPYDSDHVIRGLDQYKDQLISYLHAPKEEDILFGRFQIPGDVDKRNYISQISNGHWALKSDNTGYVLTDRVGMVLQDAKGKKFEYLLGENHG